MNDQIKTPYDLISLYLTISSSWMVYATCQGDYLLPAMGLLIITFSLLRRMFKPKIKKHKSDKKISWATIMSLSLLLSWVWITLYPRNYATDFIQSYAIFILQSGSIVLSTFLWFNPVYMYQVFFLKLLAWLTVALSVNVAFNPNAFVAFLIFCLLNISLIVFQRQKTRESPNQRTPILYNIKESSLNFLFCLITVCLFLFFIQVFKIGDEVYTRFIRDYTIMQSRHPFFTFNPVLDIQGPGISGGDVRPVLEIDKQNTSSMYLLTQIFEDYQDGRWLAAENDQRVPVANQLDPLKNNIQLRMLIQLKDVLPTPKGTDSVTGYNGPYEQDQNGIIYSVHKDIHQVKLTTDDNNQFNINATQKINRFTKLSESFKLRLRPYLDHIIGNESDPWSVTRTLERYFQSNYYYSLNVHFRADDNGIIYLLDQGPAAYCSFFASAMAVLLRAADIPSRLVVGFLATDTIGRKDDKFLVRVRDAHAWVEAYLPVEGKPGLNQWVRFDPTPPDARLFALNDGRPINMIADKIWLFLVRLRSDFENLESEKLLFWLVIILVLLISVRNYSSIVYFLKFRKTRKFKKNDTPPKKFLQDQLNIYKEFEHFLKRQFKTKQKMNETHVELIRRLYTGYPTKQQTIVKLELFLKHYQAARFGQKEDLTLKQTLNKLKRNVSSIP